ncbi:hypothetical protein [Streptomyces sp. TLI_171]|uniref:hypothetical protein n=1 Tax=Streptomyces sp. TLI_171 TaxID=1938859 RepID=UPI000C194B3D|nr:hypothetical protein [Streptomyces sp. TLI_171]RKE19772.1 hypothetical protein BX266_3100 [Streptomyces sp. TLI_171]
MPVAGGLIVVAGGEPIVGRLPDTGRLLHSAQASPRSPRRGRTVGLLLRKAEELGARGGRLIVAGAQPSFVRLTEHTGPVRCARPGRSRSRRPRPGASLEEAVARGARPPASAAAD